MPANQFGQLRAWMARNGFSQRQINDAIGVGAQGRTRAQITDQLRGYLMQL